MLKSCRRCRRCVDAIRCDAVLLNFLLVTTHSNVQHRTCAAAAAAAARQTEFLFGFLAVFDIAVCSRCVESCSRSRRCVSRPLLKNWPIGMSDYAGVHP